MSIYTSTNLHAPSIVDALLDVDLVDIGASSSKKGSKKESTKVSVLKIPTGPISKEVKRMRSCDSKTCFYCREWASYVLKNDLVNIRHTSDQPEKGNSLPSNLFETQPKEIAKIMKLLIDNMVENASGDSYSGSYLQPKNDLIFMMFTSAHKQLTNYISSATLKHFYNKLEINFDNWIGPDPVDNGVIEPDHLFEVVDISEKSSFSIYREDFDYLKPINPSLQANITTARCGHIQPDNRTPEEMKNHIQQTKLAYEDRVSRHIRDWETQAGEAWNMVFSFIGSVIQFEENRKLFLRDPNKQTVYVFHQNFNDSVMPTFSEFWSTTMEQYRLKEKNRKKQNGKPSVDFLDESFDEFISSLTFSHEHFDILLNQNLRFIYCQAAEMKESVNRWLSLSIKRIKGYFNFTSFLPSFAKLGEDQNRSEEAKKLLDVISCNCYFKEIKQHQSLQILTTIVYKNVRKSVDEFEQTIKKLKHKWETLVKELEVKKTENKILIKQIQEIWKDPELKTAASKIEKASSKDFRKQVRRLEISYGLYRSWSLDQLSNFFPLHEAAKILTNALDPLMMEAQLIHNTLLIDSYSILYEPMMNEMSFELFDLQKQFAQSIKCGRTMLSGLVGKMFLKEGMRQLEEFKAIEKQNQLLQQWDIDEPDSKKDVSLNASDVPETKAKKKNKKKKKKATEEISTPESILKQSKETILEKANSELPLNSAKSTLSQDRSSSPVHVNGKTDYLPTRSVKIASKSKSSTSTLTPALAQVDTQAPVQSKVNVPEFSVPEQAPGSILAPASDPSTPIPAAIRPNTLAPMQNGASHVHSEPSPIESFAKALADKLYNGSPEDGQGLSAYKLDEIFKILSESKASLNELTRITQMEAILNSVKDRVDALKLDENFLSADIIETCDIKTDLSKAPREKLISLIHLLLGEKDKMSDYIRYVAGQVDPLVDSHSQLVNSLHSQLDFIKAQVEHINSLKSQLVSQDAMIINLCREQACLMQYMAKIPQLKQSLDAAHLIPDHPLNGKTPMTLLKGVQLTSLVPKAAPLASDSAPEPSPSTNSSQLNQNSSLTPTKTPQTKHTKNKGKRGK